MATISVYRGTTPSFTLNFPTIDLTGWDVYISFEQPKDNVLFTLRNEDLAIIPANNGCKAQFTLTQKQTLMFSEKGQVGIQMRATQEGMPAVAGRIKTFKVNRIVLDGEIPQGGD